MVFKQALSVFLGLTAISLRSEQVVFSEVMYRPSGTRPEFIEVQNLTSTPFDIAEWKLQGGVDYDFPLFSTNNVPNTFLKAFERIVLSSADPATTRAAYNIAPSIRIYGPWSGNLSDGGERVTLKDKNGITVCTLNYDNRGHWPVSADGAGHSLVLKNSNRLVDDWRNWTASPRPGGTPGTEPVVAAETPVANPEVNLSQGLTYVDYGDRWKFHDQNQDLGTTWYATNYNDSSWMEGPGLLGFETASLPAPGIRQGLQDFDQLTYYFRTRFVYNGSLSSAVLTLDQIVDDGAVYYLNGQFMGSSGTTAGFNSPSTVNVSDAVETFNVFPINSALLRQGTNFLAVEVHQVNTDSSDLVFGARLKISVPTTGGLVINEVLPGPAGIGFVEFYNPGAAALNLNGYYLSDQPGNLQKFRITSNVMVPAGGLQVVGFSESNLSTTNPISVYLTGTNGSSVVNALSASIPADGRSLGRKPTGSIAWYLFTEHTPALPNLSQEAVNASLKLNEIQFSSSNSVSWVEIYNLASNAFSLNGLYLSARRDFADKIPLTGNIQAGGVASRDVSFPVTGSDVTLYLVTGTGVVLDSRDFEDSPTNKNHQAFPPGSGEWYASATSTRNAVNNPARNQDIIINEIMFNPPSDEIWGEFIELYNRGATAVDLSNWSLDDGVEFKFPVGTAIPPGGFLVVAADAIRLGAAHGNIPVIGNLKGRLDNNGELIRLLDAAGNLVNEVDYKVGGDWPVFSAGGGTSMELLHPQMDNRLPSSWRDSDESAKTTMRPYSFSAIYQQLDSGSFSQSEYRELFFHLVGDGHLVLDNIQLRANGTGPNVLTNSTVQSTNGFNAVGWLCQGTHWASYVTNGQLHIISDGRGDNRVNRVDLDAPGLTPGINYQLSFNARWIYGNPRLIGQTWDHSVCGSFRIFVPENLGTPGSANSRALSTPAPQVDALLHSPAVPRSTNNVKITAQIKSADPLASVVVWHRRDNATSSGVWSSKPMFDDGLSGGDLIAGDGIFTAELTEHRVNGAVVQFYVRATTTAGQATVLPRAGAEKPGLYVVDDRTLARDLHLKRFVISAFDLGAISSGNVPLYQYRFPRSANHYFNMTYIADEKEIYYNGEMHNAGSPWTRDPTLNRGKWKLPKDRLFRGHEKFTYDNDPTAGRRHHNRIVRYWLYLLGHVANENEFMRVVVNNGSADIREDTEHVANDFLNRNFEDGSAGDLYQIEDAFWYGDGGNWQNRDADWGYRGTENSGHYRTAYAKRSNEVDDDFTALINFFRIVTGNGYSQSDIDRLIDGPESLKMAAVRGYIGDWDSFTLNRGKNMFFYRRPNDGKFQFLHWDSDLGFRTGEVLYGGRVSNWISKPYNRRLFYGYLVELLQNYTKNSARMNGWLQAEEDANSSFPVDSAFYRNWFIAREAYVLANMGVNFTRPFEATSNGGNPISTSSDTLSINGASPFGVLSIQVAGHPEATVSWTSENLWTISGIVLATGTNNLNVLGLNQNGQVIKQDTITVTKTGNSAPVLAAAPDPGWRAGVNETFSLDASGSFDPDAGPLNLNWTVDQPGSVRMTNLTAATFNALATRPGLYNFTLLGVDVAGRTNQLVREVAVYGASGFSSFSAAYLEPFWNFSNIDYRNNTPNGSWLSLEEIGGGLRVQIPGDVPYWLTNSNATYPSIWRSIPTSTDWSFHAQFKMDTREFGNFMTGLQIEAVEAGTTNRYVFGVENGNQYALKRVSPSGVVVALHSSICTNEEITVRARRVGQNLLFERRLDDVWLALYTNALALNTATTRGGLFLATSLAQASKVQFDYAMLIDPSDTSALREFLRVTEVMYNPIEGDNFEFIELMNTGSSDLDLTNARFTNGVTYTFGSQILAPGQRIVVVKDRPAFFSRYSPGGIIVAEGAFSGRLDNGGETLSLVDANTNLVLNFTYGDSGNWPERADGFGASLEVVDTFGDFDDPDNWRSSSEYHGTPGRQGAGPLNTVVINEVLTHSDPPLEDAIELHNLTGADVNIGGWFLSDDISVPNKFRIPDNTILPAQGYQVFYEIDFNINNPLVAFSMSSAEGDDVFLTSADGSGNLLAFVDDVDFGPSENGVSFGRYPDGTGPMVSMSLRTFGSDTPANVTQFRAGAGLTNAYPKVGLIVVTEFMYQPAGVGDEYIKLQNISSNDVTLFDPLARTNTWKLQGAVDFTFPTNITLPPNGSLLIVSIDPGTFRVRYQIANTVPILSAFSGNLNNSGETIELYKPDPPQTLPPNVGLVPYVLVEKIKYDDNIPWPPLAAGGGPPLYRVGLTNYANDPLNWSTQPPDLDADDDGMPDAWETAHGLDPQSSGDAALDLDLDGLTNLQEYLAGTNPLDILSTLSLNVSRSSAGAVIQFDAMAEKSYSIWYNDSLVTGGWVNWTNLPARSTNHLPLLTNDWSGVPIRFYRVVTP